MTSPFAGTGGVSASPPAIFFDTLYQHFEQARQNAGLIERFYQIGGYSVRLQFAGEALLAPFTLAFEHLAIEPDPAPALTLCIWDSESTGVKPPQRPWTDADHLPRGEVRGYNDERFTTIYELGFGALNVLDNMRNLGIYWRSKASDLPYSEMAAPLQQMLPAWMQRHGRAMLHAAGVGDARGGVVIAGKSGSGKSSTALACLDSALSLLGDDSCLLTNEPVPYVYSLYATGKLKADNLWRFPKLAEQVSNIDQLDREKATIFFNQHLPEKLIAGFPVRALLIPRITGQAETHLQAASPMLGLRTLGPSTLFQTATQSAETFAYLGEFVRRVPSYYLDLGTDLATIAPAINRLLDELAV